LLQQKHYQSFTLFINQITLITPFFMSSLFIIDIFYALGELISLYLLRCKRFAVDNHSCIFCASHLQQPQLVNNSGYKFMLKSGSIFCSIILSNPL
jgi:hypothetical protein